jgi:hypothetical protein
MSRRGRSILVETDPPPWPDGVVPRSRWITERIARQ